MTNKDPFDTLVDRLVKMHKAAVGRVSPEVRNRQQLKTHWNMGKFIVESQQLGELRARYGARLLAKLSASLTKRLGTGYSERHLQEMRRFHLEYPIPHPGAELSSLNWSHFRILMGIKDEKKRAELTRRTVLDALTKNQLATLARQANSFSAIGEASNVAEVLVPRKAQRGLYKLVTHSWEPGVFLLDGGFGALGKVEADLLDTKEPGAIIKSQHDGRYVAVDCEVGERYCFTGTVQNVIDGDTVKVRMDLFPRWHVIARLRLRGVMAPELGSPEGEAAREFARERLLHRRVLVLTYSTDIYGRYKADLFYRTDGRAPRRPLEKNSLFFNAEIIEAELAGLMP